ncbi:oxygenase MpaB family protein [Streptomyces sp. NPDC001941]|uniref:oxygenase MpaB family protein n=1 Tax=Streptomyces sp. NPDC001941 TaxID=3154659 RepID=UPI00332CB072
MRVSPVLSLTLAASLGLAPVAAHAASPPDVTAVAAKAAEPGPQDLERLKQVGDAEANAVVDDLFARGQVAKVNQLLTRWKTNGQPLPEGLPPKLASFLESARKLPAWVDPAALERAQRYASQRHVPLVLTAVATATDHIRHPGSAAVLAGAVEGDQMPLMVAKVGKVLESQGRPGAFGPTGTAVVLWLKTRLVHAALNHLLLNSGHWDTARFGVPFSQYALLADWGAFFPYVLGVLERVDIPMTAQQEADFIHMGRVAGHLLGVANVPTNPAEARRVHRLFEAEYAKATEDGAAVMAATVGAVAARTPLPDITKPLLSSMIRFMIGPREADQLRLPKSPFWDGVVGRGLPVLLGLQAKVADTGVPMGVLNELVDAASNAVLAAGRSPELLLPTTLAAPGGRTGN